ncbi:MAG TPA: acyltransferase, partial [Phycisphaerales bacterium]|nr:acyltransferase [Phycisphaerales bacterium]
MARVTRAALIQASNDESSDSPIDKIKSVMIDKHLGLIKEAADKGAQV